MGLSRKHRFPPCEPLSLPGVLHSMVHEGFSCGASHFCKSRKGSRGGSFPGIPLRRRVTTRKAFPLWPHPREDLWPGGSTLLFVTGKTPTCAPPQVFSRP